MDAAGPGAGVVIVGPLGPEERDHLILVIEQMPDEIGLLRRTAMRQYMARTAGVEL